MSLSVAENIDCMIRLREAPDNHWDLAICDPPYGLGRMSKVGNDKHNRISLLKAESFNNHKPTAEYFNELFRVSRGQIIFGANNFLLPTSEYFLIWNKQQTVTNFASAEYAWVSPSLRQPALVFNFAIHQHNQIHKIHPTQKPTELYRWLLTNYAKPNDRILDTHLGSGSSRIAAYDLGFDFTGYELDKDYFDAQEKRFANHIAQPKLFAPTITMEQGTLI